MGCAQSVSAQSKKPAPQAEEVNGIAKALPLPVALDPFLPVEGPLSLEDFRARLLSTDGMQHIHMEKSGYRCSV